MTWRSKNLDSLQNIHSTLANHRSGGRLPVYIDYTNEEATARIKLGDDWQINPTAQLIESLTRTEGVSDVDIVY